MGPRPHLGSIFQRLHSFPHTSPPIGFNTHPGGAFKISSANWNRKIGGPPYRFPGPTWKLKVLQNIRSRNIECGRGSSPHHCQKVPERSMKGAGWPFLFRNPSLRILPLSDLRVRIECPDHILPSLVAPQLQSYNAHPWRTPSSFGRIFILHTCYFNSTYTFQASRC